ncbi:MAG: helix-hairpin-helix domain-containing protein [Gammaproteobacteria bacterium]|nr:helix-hairpin-helix domain-containing protein [Gammaproteobacteria bacterium]
MMKIIQSVLLSLLLSISASVLAAQVNINKADAATLSAELVGVGEKKAEAIVAYREANGPFKSAEELTNVKGIGESTLKKNADNILTE